MSFQRRSSLVLAWFVGVGRLQLLVQSSLAVGEPLWHVNLKPHVEVAGAASSEAGQSLPDEAQDRVRFARFSVRIDGAQLNATLWGEPLDVARHAPACEPKGATYAALQVAAGRKGVWSAACVVDV
jgi:Archease protein family (MTH1598/TM1083)